MSSDLGPNVLDTWIKRRVELSIDHHLVMSWVRWPGRKPHRPGRPKQVVRVCWECLAENPVKMDLNSYLRRRRFNHILELVESMEYEWAMFRTAIVEAAARSCDNKVTGASMVVTPGPTGGHQR